MAGSNIEKEKNKNKKKKKIFDLIIWSIIPFSIIIMFLKFLAIVLVLALQANCTFNHPSFLPNPGSAFPPFGIARPSVMPGYSNGPAFTTHPFGPSNDLPFGPLPPTPQLKEMNIFRLRIITRSINLGILLYLTLIPCQLLYAIPHHQLTSLHLLPSVAHTNPTSPDLDLPLSGRIMDKS